MQSTAQKAPHVLGIAARLSRPQWIAGLTGLLLVHRLWEPLGRDQAAFALVGQLVWDGRLPYRDVFEHKPPGLLLLYALAAPLGDVAPAVLDTLAAMLTAGLLVALLQPLGRSAALLAGALYALLARHPVFGGFWDIGQPEPLQELALVVGAWAALNRRWFALGAAVSAALSLKFTLVLAAPVALLAAWPDKRALGRVAAGLALPPALLVAAMALAGGLAPMIDIVIGFNQRHAARGSLALAQVPAALLSNLRHFFLAFSGVAVLAGLALRSGQQRARRFATLVLVAAAVQALMQAKLWVWHWQAVVLPLCVLAGLGLASLGPRMQKLLGTAALLVAIPGWLQYHTRHPWPARAIGQLSRAEWLQGYTWGRRDWSAIEIAATGAWLRKHAEPGDQLLVWGFEPGIYLASGLRPATRWIYDYPLSVALDPAQKQAGIAEIAAHLPQTRWWVVMGADRNALEPLPSDQQLQRIPALQGALQRDYTLVERVGDVAIYQRRVTAQPVP